MHTHHQQLIYPHCRAKASLTVFQLTWCHITHKNFLTSSAYSTFWGPWRLALSGDPVPFQAPLWFTQPALKSAECLLQAQIGKFIRIMAKVFPLCPTQWIGKRDTHGIFRPKGQVAELVGSLLEAISAAPKRQETKEEMKHHWCPCLFLIFPCVSSTQHCTYCLKNF